MAIFRENRIKTVINSNQRDVARRFVFTLSPPYCSLAYIITTDERSKWQTRQPVISLANVGLRTRTQHVQSLILSHRVNYFNRLTKLMFYCITNCLSSRLCGFKNACGCLLWSHHNNPDKGQLAHIYIYCESYFISHTECWTWSLIKKTRELPQYKQTLMPVKLTTAQHESSLFTYIVHQALERITTQNANNNYRGLSCALFHRKPKYHTRTNL